MRSYLASLILGVAVGVVYGLVRCVLRHRLRSHFSASSVCWLVAGRIARQIAYVQKRRPTQRVKRSWWSGDSRRCPRRHGRLTALPTSQGACDADCFGLISSIFLVPQCLLQKEFSVALLLGRNLRYRAGRVEVRIDCRCHYSRGTGNAMHSIDIKSF
jgi:hypothetical protein